MSSLLALLSLITESIASKNPTAGLSGVELVFVTKKEFVDRSAKTMSVNVPPISTAMEIFFDVLGILWPTRYC